MEKLEYIPGDIVKIEYGEATGKIGFVTNTFLRRKGCYSLVVFIGKGFQGSSKDDWIQTYNDEVSPFPLTPEILSANSFKRVRQDESGALYFKEGLGIDIVASYVRNCYDICIRGNRILKGIEYCHQFQHFLFGLGLEYKMKL